MLVLYSALLCQGCLCGLATKREPMCTCDRVSLKGRASSCHSVPRQDAACPLGATGWLRACLLREADSCTVRVARQPRFCCGAAHLTLPSAKGLAQCQADRGAQ